MYLITDQSEISDVPVGIPFMFGDESSEKFIVRLMEYEILYQAALMSGYPFDFKQILSDNGYKNLESFGYDKTVYMDINDKFEYKGKFEAGCVTDVRSPDSLFKRHMKDAAVYVDITKLKELHIMPIWLDKIEDAISTNIHNFAVFNPHLYNKKLDGMYGGIELVAPGKNLIIIDVSSSIPKGVAATCLALSKNLCNSFYADLLITGNSSSLYNHDEVSTLDMTTVYDTHGGGQECAQFRKIITESDREYATAIVFGDNHSPSQSWGREPAIDRAIGKKLCTWKINKLVSFHTTSTYHTAGYADWFDCTNIDKVGDWVKYLDV